jgi:ParB family transcriptional regulator, chromosome partitioning protein
MLSNSSVVSKDLIAKIKIEDIKIDKRFRKDVGDIKKLANSISEVGLLHPIVVNENNELVAGQRRLEACKLFGWSEVPVNVVNLKDIVKGEFHENANRKDFTISEIVEIKKSIEPMEIEKAKERFDIANSRLKILAAELAGQAKFNNNTEKEELK